MSLVVESAVLASHLSKAEANDVRGLLKAAARTHRSEEGIKLCYMAVCRLNIFI